MKVRTRIAIASALFAAALWPEVCQAYPGNANFRNKPVTFLAKTRTDWVTNATTMVGSARNPGKSTPLNWAKAQSITNGIDYLPAVLTPEGGWPRKMVCHFIRVDLTTRNLRFTGSDRCENWGDPMPDDPKHQCKKPDGSFYTKRTVREKTGDFLARLRGPKSEGGKGLNAVLAWNNAAWSPWKPPYTNEWGCPNGPLYSDGIQVSDVDTGYGTHGGPKFPNGIFVVYKDGKADIVPQITKAMVSKVWFSVPAFVAHLVSAGKAPPHGDKSVRPRTAIGLSKDKKTFYLLVCDGDNDKSWTKGCDFPSLSTLLVAMGCHEAFNLDGGGSSNLCVWDYANNCPAVLGRPGGNWHSTNSQRDNGSNAAIYFK